MASNARKITTKPLSHIVLKLTVEEAEIEQLRQVGDHPQVHQRPDVVGGTLTQLLALDPLGHVNPSGRVLGIVPRYDHVRQHPHLQLHLLPVEAFQVVIQFLVEAKRELVEQCHGVESIRQCREFPDE